MDTDQNICMDESVRPSSLDDFIGQEELRKNLKVYIQAAKTRGQAMVVGVFIFIVPVAVR